MDGSSLLGSRERIRYSANALRARTRNEYEGTKKDNNSTSNPQHFQPTFKLVGSTLNDHDFMLQRKIECPIGIPGVLIALRGKPSISANTLRSLSRNPDPEARPKKA